MKRLRRRIFNALAGLSLLLFVATCVLWAQSDYYPGTLNVSSASLLFRSEHADLRVERYQVVKPPPRSSFAPYLLPRELCWFHYPDYLPFGILPFIWFMDRMYSGRNRSSRGRCENCGYDLRATPDRCPECGTRVPLSVRRTLP